MNVSQLNVQSNVAIPNSPFNNMVMVDGLILPLDNLPENMQQMVLQARAQGKDIEFTTKYEDQ